MNARIIIDELKKFSSYAIIAHVSPDGDALGSSLGLYNALKSIGKYAEVFIDDDLPSHYSYLPGFNQVNSHEYDEKEYDKIIILDCGDIERCGRFKDFVLENKSKAINIDHHISNTKFAEINYVLPDASSVGEIVYYLIKEAHIQITKDIATCLYTSILTDTGGFKYSNTKKSTHMAAAELIDHGVEFTRIQEKIFNSRTISQTRLLACVLPTMKLYFDNKVAVLYMTQQMIKECGAEDESTGEFVSYARDIDTAEVGIFIKEKNDNICRVSLRSKSYIDVNKIAEKFSGGGHMRAAGCTINGTVEYALEQLIDTMKGSFIME